MCKKTNKGLGRQRKGKRAGDSRATGKSKVRRVDPLDHIIGIVDDSPSSSEASQLDISTLSSSSVEESILDTLTNESSTSTRETLGIAGEAFLEGINVHGSGIDWRSFGRKTFADWEEAGHIEQFLKRIESYNHARNWNKGASFVVFHDELPLSVTGEKRLQTMLMAVRYLLLHLREVFNDGNSLNCVKKVSEAISAVMHDHS